MKFFVETVKGKKIDVEDYLEKIKENISLNRNIFELTPICQKQDKSYFWYEDVNEFYDLKTESVKELIKEIKKEKKKNS